LELLVIGALQDRKVFPELLLFKALLEQQEHQDHKVVSDLLAQLEQTELLAPKVYQVLQLYKVVPEQQD
jgi:hypothetical protein